MNRFEWLQDEFQRAVLTGDDAILGEILDSPKEKRDVLFGVYRHAYGARLVESLRTDHALLHSYVGDETFDAMGYAYVAASPSYHPNIRWFARALPDFLGATEPYSNYPVLSELAALEKALNDAFDSADAPALQVADLAQVPSEQWNGLRFQAQPGACRLDFTTNAAAIWLALKNDEPPPDASTLDEPARILVWRKDVTPMFRELGAEEAMMWDEATSGVPFGVLCSMLATFADPDTAAARGAGYLHGWVTSELLTAASQGG